MSVPLKVSTYFRKSVKLCGLNNAFDMMIVLQLYYSWEANKMGSSCVGGAEKNVSKTTATCCGFLCNF